MKKRTSGRGFPEVLACMVLLSAWSIASAQAPFGVKSSAPDNSAKEQRARVAIKVIEEISVKAGPDQESVDEVFELSQSAIGRLKAAGTQALPSIEAVLRDPSKNWKLKAMMCEALGKIKGPESERLLETVLGDTGQHEFVRAVAGHAMASSREKKHETLLKRIVSDSSVPIKIRARIMMAVGQTGLDDVEWLKKAAVGDGLGLPADKQARISQDQFGLILNAQRALGQSKNPRAVDALLELADKNPGNANLIEMLGRKGDRRAVPILIKALKAKPRASNSDIQAAMALGDLRATEAIDELIKMMREDPSPLLVAHVCEALAKIGDKRALAPMQELVANMKTDARFNDAGGVYWRQAEHGNGPIPKIKDALAILEK